MEPKWQSLEEIVDEFRLQDCHNSRANIRDGLKKIIAKLHHDRNNNSFSSKEDEKIFLRAIEAKDLLDSGFPQSLSLVETEQFPMIIAAITQAVELNKKPNIEAMYSQSIETAFRNTSRRLFIPKVGSGAFAAASLFLLTFPEKFQKNPLFETFFKTPAAYEMIGTMLIYSVFLFFCFWVLEKYIESKSEYLASESSLSRIFSALKRIAEYNSGRISTQQVTRVIQLLSTSNNEMPRNLIARVVEPRYTQGGSIYLSSSLFSFFGLDVNAAEKIAVLQIQRLLDKKLIKRFDIVSVDTWYQIDEAT